jgi:hypothetical protein
MRKLILAAVMVLLSTEAFAAMTKPHAIDSVIKSETAYGQGKLSKLFIKVYDASLWTDAKEWSEDSVYALALQYDLSIDGADLAERSIEEMQHVSPYPKEKDETFKAQLLKVFPDVKKGDVITALFDPKKGATFYHNDKLSGAIKDLDLAKRFMEIWLSPNTSEPRLRQALLKTNG